MLITSCLHCEFHEVKQDELEMSYCSKENCWSQFSKCVMRKALDRFLKEEDFIRSKQSLHAPRFEAAES